MLEHRLKTEYQTEIVMEGMPFRFVRWVVKAPKDVKDLKLKVKVTIEADKLRVSSASKDALQSVIAYLRDQDYGQPLQFTNYR